MFQVVCWIYFSGPFRSLRTYCQSVWKNKLMGSQGIIFLSFKFWSASDRHLCSGFPECRYHHCCHLTRGSMLRRLRDQDLGEKCFARASWTTGLQTEQRYQGSRIASGRPDDSISNASPGLLSPSGGQGHRVSVTAERCFGRWFPLFLWL